MRRLLFFISFTLVLIFISSTPTLSEGNSNLYVIENIIIDIPNTGKNREQALAKARRQAIKQLFFRLLHPEDQYINQQVDQETLKSWVQQVNIQDETTTPKSYRAKFHIGFNRPMIDQFLSMYGLNVTSYAPSSFLIIPIYQESSETKPILWEDNPWHLAWSTLSTQSTVTPMIVPLGDIEDIRDLNVSQILDLEKSAFDRIAQRYQAGDNLILAAQLNTQNQLHIAASRLGNIDQVKFYEKIFPTHPESLPQDLNKIVQEVAGDLDILLSQERFVESDQSTLEAEVYVPIHTLAEWQDIQARLKKTPTIRTYDILSINRLQVMINMRTKADIPTLKASLQSNGLKLDQDAQGWVLRLDPPQPLLQKPTSTMPTSGFLQVP